MRLPARRPTIDLYSKLFALTVRKKTASASVIVLRYFIEQDVYSLGIRAADLNQG
jgi:hypothetical protein